MAKKKLSVKDILLFALAFREIPAAILILFALSALEEKPPVQEANNEMTQSRVLASGSQSYSHIQK